MVLRKLHYNSSNSCAESNAKRVSLELGGKSPLIIFNDCDLDRAVRQVRYTILTQCMFIK